MAILDDVRQALRVTSQAYDTEITDIIDACKEDLKGAGVLENKISDTDKYIKRAIITYSKAHFGMANPDMVKQLQVYRGIKSHLAQNVDYTT